MSQLDNEIIYGLSMECSIADHRPCELATVIGMAVDISQQEDIALPPQLQLIMDTQTLTESGVRLALHEWMNTIPESQKEVAAGLLSILENG
ncbi:hypothetical protein [Paenibacillus ihbetae]|uniref:Uncharacterized protein n=1 Tax=Paenibacillus ihbetae TaxID=1870820 RepID=A0A1B2E1D9_9BACL|nr:hypothetical protein [Paenibacillus ihbetae]ANY73810.1 hypothetical protein BBD41_15170 [Paenibacillus ihbetae]OOC64008.1 hypothetical protein BBD40_20375 [Paenibacillus ihbetae]